MASQADLLLGSMGYFFIVGTLLGLSGVGGVAIVIPSGHDAGGTEQSFGVAVLECIVTLFGDCSEKTQTGFFTAISDVVEFASKYLFFFLQLLTYQLPVPVWLNSIVVLPPAMVMLYVGFRFIRGGG